MPAAASGVTLDSLHRLARLRARDRDRQSRPKGEKRDFKVIDSDAKDDEKKELSHHDFTRRRRRYKMAGEKSCLDVDNGSKQTVERDGERDNGSKEMDSEADITDVEIGIEEEEEEGDGGGSAEDMEVEDGSRAVPGVGKCPDGEVREGLLPLTRAGRAGGTGTVRAKLPVWISQPRLVTTDISSGSLPLHSLSLPVIMETNLRNMGCHTLFPVQVLYMSDRE